MWKHATGLLLVCVLWSATPAYAQRVEIMGLFGWTLSDGVETDTAVVAGDGVNPPPTTPYQGLDHFGLTVSGIDAVVAELKAKGAEFTMEPTNIRPGVRIAFLRGPEGVSIELLERSPA